MDNILVSQSFNTYLKQCIKEIKNEMAPVIDLIDQVDIYFDTIELVVFFSVLNRVSNNIKSSLFKLESLHNTMRVVSHLSSNKEKIETND